MLLSSEMLNIVIGEPESIRFWSYCYFLPFIAFAPSPSGQLYLYRLRSCYAPICHLRQFSLLDGKLLKSSFGCSLEFDSAVFYRMTHYAAFFTAFLRSYTLRNMFGNEILSSAPKTDVAATVYCIHSHGSSWISNWSC